MCERGRDRPPWGRARGWSTACSETTGWLVFPVQMACEALAGLPQWRARLAGERVRRWLVFPVVSAGLSVGG
ncbi:hypothetical protein Acsp04_50960 [Actinomadura sp. NBRC 104425]|nr:hypothetical protein Acsp04_50960 [Actinomadura sp. NBRC 104425]